MKTMSKKLRLLTPILVLGLILSGCSFLNVFENVTAVAQTSSLSYPIVDTGQTQNYSNTSAISAPSAGSAFYGQDAQIDGNQPNYVDNGDGTVTDVVTGLMWQQGYSGKMTYSQAVASVDSFSLAGYSDWRLPTIKELYSLIDFSGLDVSTDSGSGAEPFIDTNFFEFAYGDTSAGERIIDSQWVTTTLYTGSSGFGQLMFGVNFADGRIKGYGTGAMGPNGEKTFYVRYVRGNTSYGENSFMDNGDGTISDLATGLMWAQDDSGSGMDWEDALAYVQDLNNQNYLGYSDWYLPNAKELQSIVDYDRSPDATNSAAIDPIFNATAITNEDGERDWGFYWTGTTHASARGGQSAVYIAFGRGLGYMNNRYSDVHGAGCQRSDPKTGSATSRGPQGDVVRVTNLIRVTRSIEGTLGSMPSMVGDDTSASEAGGTLDTVASSSDEGEQDYVLFAPVGGTTAYLIDRDGNVVNDWSLSGRPGNSVYLTEGGNLLATYTIQGSINAGGKGGGVEMLTWEGTQMWSFELATDHAHLHHDVAMLPNGNVLLISWEAKTHAEALAAGLTADQLPGTRDIWAEMILEYDPTSDQIVWEWHLWDHILPEGWLANEHPEKIDLDAFANPRTQDWWHFNSIDYSEALDQIVVSSRTASEIWIIDHDLSTAEAAGTAGDLLYRYGNPEMYGASGVQVLLAQHDAEFIDTDTVLVFDNGTKQERPYSRVLELDLPNYMSSSSSQARVLPSQIVWKYPSEPGIGTDAWFADHISGAQRLENGNTLICSGTNGRFFEVTPSGETVWEYVNPFSTTSPNGASSNEVFKCEMYTASSPELAGQDLSAAVQVDAQASESPQDNAPAPPQDPNIRLVDGIHSVEPSNVTATGEALMLTIQLKPQFAPPEAIQFSSIRIGSIEATSWTRSENSITAWFAIPTSATAGSNPLTITFPGRNGRTVVFTSTIEIN